MKWVMSSRPRIAIAIFLVVAAMLLLLHANRVVATNDEGILLDAAQRVAGGERPYVDFWAYMSPGSYWLQAIVFRFFGISLLTARLLVIFDFALQCALVFWLTSKLASLRTAIAVTIAFLGFQMADPSFLTAQHRWDSSTLALAGVAIAASAASKRAWVASGVVLAVAAWCTPTVGGVLIVVSLWLWFQRERRRELLPLLSGAAIPFAAGGALLIVQGGLIPFVQQMLWLRQNYLVNAMPYGSILGGYGALFEDMNGVLDWVIRSLLVGCVALPAVLPPLALLGRPKVEGLEHIPSSGPAILASNHLAVADSFFLPLVVSRRITFLAKSEYFTGKGLKGTLKRWFFTAAGQVPIDRTDSDAAQAA